MQRDIKAIVDGAVGGCIGTAAMSLVMLAADEAGLMGEQPPKRIVNAALDATGLGGRSEETENALAVLMHFGFGVGCGSLFAVLHRRLRLPISAAVHGVIFGSLVWGASYKGWVPTLGIMPQAERDRRDRQAAMVVARWVYGATMGMVVGDR